MRQTLRDDDSTLSVMRKRNVLSVYTHQDCLLTNVSNTPSIFARSAEIVVRILLHILIAMPGFLPVST